jgi:hypothetical protein
MTSKEQESGKELRKASKEEHKRTDKSESTKTPIER